MNIQLQFLYYVPKYFSVFYKNGYIQNVEPFYWLIGHYALFRLASRMNDHVTVDFLIRKKIHKTKKYHKYHTLFHESKTPPTNYWRDEIMIVYSCGHPEIARMMRGYGVKYYLDHEERRHIILLLRTQQAEMLQTMIDNGDIKEQNPRVIIKPSGNVSLGFSLHPTKRVEIEKNENDHVSCCW
jgi:hypothetical protein